MDKQDARALARVIWDEVVVWKGWRDAVAPDIPVTAAELARLLDRIASTIDKMMGK